jgi:hypothetical protein
MAAVPLKPEYGPTLGGLLAPRWHAASPWVRRAVGAMGVALLATAVAVVLTLVNPTYTHGGRLPFSFGYRDLYRVAPDPGGYVKVQKRGQGGALLYSFAVDPLVLPPYTGDPLAQLPLYAAGYIGRVRRTYPGFVLRGEGVTKVNLAQAYDVVYTTRVEGREMFGKDVLMLPERAGAREGVDIVMLTAPKASHQVLSPVEVATTGVLLRPLKSFSLG